MSFNKGQAIALVTLILWSSASLGATAGKETNVLRLLNDNKNFGHCMIFTTAVVSIDCPAGWFSLDCKGSFHEKETTRRLWDAAQLAFVTDSLIYLVANDQKKHNGYCVLDRLDVVK